MSANRHYTIGKRIDGSDEVQVIAAFNLPLAKETLAAIVDNARFVFNVKVALEDLYGDRYEIFDRQDVCPIAIFDRKGERHE